MPIQSLTDAIESAREQNGRYRSVLMQQGAVGALPLLDADSTEGGSQLLDSLAELRKVIEQHQRVVGHLHGHAGQENAASSNVFLPLGERVDSLYSRDVRRCSTQIGMRSSMNVAS